MASAGDEWTPEECKAIAASITGSEPVKVAGFAVIVVLDDETFNIAHNADTPGTLVRIMLDAAQVVVGRHLDNTPYPT